MEDLLSKENLAILEEHCKRTILCGGRGGGRQLEYQMILELIKKYRENEKIYTVEEMDKIETEDMGYDRWRII